MIAVKVDRNNRQTVGDNGWWREGAEGQDMECKPEDPAGYLSFLHPLMFCLGNFDHVLCEWNKFFIGWSVVGPPDRARVPVFIDQSTDIGGCVVKRETSKICPAREDLVVTLT